MSMFIERGKHQNNHNGSQNITINSIEYVEVAGFEVIAGKAGTGIIAGLGLTGIGTYIALAPQGSKGHEVKEHAKDKAHESKEKAKSKAEEAAERERKRDEERAPKPNPNADSAKRHEGHAETNERKLRKGKFSDVEFDNHITSHSTDPAADFEVKKPASK